MRLLTKLPTQGLSFEVVRPGARKTTGLDSFGPMKSPLYARQIWPPSERKKSSSMLFLAVKMFGDAVAKADLKRLSISTETAVTG